MKQTRVRIAVIFLTALLLQGLFVPSLAENTSTTEEYAFAAEEGSLSLNCKSAVLMEATTGTVLYTQNADEALPPASVTKIMTLLLVMEEIDSGRVHLDDTVTVSANAASMGGSQVYLKEGEQMMVEDLLKSVVIASANDAAVALAEHVAGSLGVFVERMNAKARALGMTASTFENATGLDDTATGHLTSARDIAIMSRALLEHPTILQYSSIWMDTIRDGAFGLTNTNRLVRFYPGCTGLKTGSTARAKFCISATAERDGLSLIAVVMAAESRDVRNATAAKLLDFGFANYSIFSAEQGSCALPVTGGVSNSVSLSWEGFCAVVPKGTAAKVETKIELPESVPAPIQKGDTAGRVVYLQNGNEIGSVPIVAEDFVDRMSFGALFWRLCQKFLLI